MITKEKFASFPTYTSYRNHIDQLLAEQKTTGHEQTPEKVEFTRLNVQRMNRVEKTSALSEEQKNAVNNLPRQNWLVIAEAWCGDCAQIIPVLDAIAKASEGKIDFRICLRDDNPEIMNQFLSNGARAVPKLVMMDEAFSVIDTWGSRPAAAQAIAEHYKANKQTISKEQFEQDLHLWYGRDRGKEIIREIMDKIKAKVSI